MDAAGIEALGALPWLGAPAGDWLAQVRAFVGTHAEGGLELVQVRPWSAVLSAGPANGRVLFKAAAPGGRHEAALVAALAGDAPGLVPAPVALDPVRRWLLLPDCGARLRDALDGTQLRRAWLELLPRYAELQRSSARQLARWRALGVPDRSPGQLPGLLRELLDGPVAREAGLGPEERDGLRARLPDLERTCRDLAELGVAAALDHGDLHDGNVLVRDGHMRLLDWGDACIAHPFVSLRVTLRGDSPDGIDMVRDAYLEAWTAEAPRRALREGFDRAWQVAAVGRALDWAGMLEGTGAAARREWLPRLALWLRGWASGAPVAE